MLTNPYVLPVSSRPNQTFKARIIVDGENIELTLDLHFREVCGYWTMDISDKSGQMLVSNLPLIIGNPPADNLLAQFSHLNLGHLLLFDRANLGSDGPDGQQLGSEFLLLWGSEA